MFKFVCDLVKNCGRGGFFFDFGRQGFDHSLHTPKAHNTSRSGGFMSPAGHSSSLIGTDGRRAGAGHYLKCLLSTPLTHATASHAPASDPFADNDLPEFSNIHALLISSAPMHILPIPLLLIHVSHLCSAHLCSVPTSLRLWTRPSPLLGV